MDMKRYLFTLLLSFPVLVFSQWKVVAITNMFDICMASRVMGYGTHWLYGPTPHSSEAQLYKTNNCWVGSSVIYDYECITSGTAGTGLTNLTFINDTIGWFVEVGSDECEHGLFRTLDGHNFSAMQQPHHPDKGYFVSAGTGYIYGKLVLYTLDGTLVRYRNGVYTNVRTFPGEYEGCNSVYFINDSTGFISHRTYFERTSDWGATWSILDSITGKISAIQFPSQAVGYVVKPDNKIYRTIDGGVTWTVTGAPAGSWLYSLFFTSESTGYAVGKSGRIIHTSDAGQTWEIEPSPVTSNLYRVQFVKGGIGFIEAGSTLLKLFRHAPALCMVTCDSSAKKNVVLWDTTGGLPGSHYNIYRQSSGGGEYLKIAEVTVDQAGIYTDIASTPSLGAAGYALSFTDSIGEESTRSLGQHTMFLKFFQDSLTGPSLQWTPYGGSPVNGYLIYRKAIDAPWELVDTVDSTVLQYPLEGLRTPKASYLVKALRSDTCQFLAGNGESPMSNIIRDAPAICMVTCDSSSYKNVVSWDATGGQPGSHYKIYRRSSGGGEYLEIAEVPAGQTGIYTDFASTPSLGADSYAISYKESIGLESLISLGHHTMFLEFFQDSLTGPSLQWSPYEGSPVNNYHIYRKTLNSPWEFVGSVDSTVLQYSLEGIRTPKAGYLVEAQQSDPCLFLTGTAGSPMSNIIRDTIGICMVTCDSASNKNVVSWDMTGGQPGSHYNIFRQPSGGGTCLKIAEVPAGQAGNYTDLTSTPSVGADWYALTYADSTGVESVRSPEHRTMFLEIYQDPLTGPNLKWTPYAGSPVMSYLIFRKALNAQWEVVGTVDSAVLHYSLGDFLVQKAGYLIKALQSAACQFVKGIGESPISNIVDFYPSGFDQHKIPGIKIHPNPAGDRLFIEQGDWQAIHGKAEIFSPDGRRWHQVNLSEKNTQIEVSDLDPGLYILIISFKDCVFTEKFIKL
jgi:hypothetical protein